MKVPENIKNLQPYIPGKPTEELERELGIKESIKLASNENPLGPSPKALAKIVSEIPKLNLYPDGSGFYLRKKIAEKFNWSTDGVILGNGSVDLIELAVRTFCEKGDEVLIPASSFIMCKLVALSMGLKIIEVPFKNYFYDVEGIIKNINKNTRIIYIDNPSNPLGTYINKEEWQRIIEALPEDTLLIADQAYFEYITKDDYPDAFEDLKKGANLLVLRTFSKIYGLAGLRIGYGLSKEEIIGYMNRVRSPFNTNSLAQTAAMAALEDYEFVEKSKKLNEEELKFLTEELKKMGLDVVPSVTNFVLVDFKKDSLEIYNGLLKEGVIVRPVKNYNLPTCLRISIGKRDENLKLLKALQKVL